MTLNLYQVDAFTEKVFGGNPAAVVPLDEWISDDEMQKIANENNLSETAFFVKYENKYHIRWFTPTSEINLCGHATLASAFVIFNILGHSESELNFISKSGELSVVKEEGLFCLNFPARSPKEIQPNNILINALGKTPKFVYFDKTILCVFENEKIVKDLAPKVNEFLKLDTHGVIITAPGNNEDFVSRFFAPDVGIEEDPVTGYAHTLLIPFWSKQLNKNKLTARQISKRGGFLMCENLDNRVKIAGKAVLYLEGRIKF